MPLEQPKVIEMQETSPGTFAEVVSETPSGGELPNKLSVYFVLDQKKVRATGDDSPNELGEPISSAVDNPATFIEVSMNFVSEKPGEIHDLLRACVGVIVQTKDSNGKAQITPLALTA